MTGRLSLHARGVGGGMVAARRIAQRRRYREVRVSLGCFGSVRVRMSGRGGDLTNAREIVFPEHTGLESLITHVAIDGVKFKLERPLRVTRGVTPKFKKHALRITES